MMDELLNAAVSLLHQARYAVALTGAGISTRSGIPDFRSPQSGLWQRNNPAEVASIHSFKHRPQDFYDWIRPLAHTILAAAPNPAHLALARMESSGRLKSVITQNIDMLHTRAGSRLVHEVHGHLRDATCINCFRVYPVQEHMPGLFENHALPLCPACGHVLKPNVVLYGEQLPAQAFSAAQRDARRCDVMLIAGSSLEVYPAAQLPVIAWRAGASLIIVNLDATPIDTLAQIVIHADLVDILPQIAADLETMQEKSP